MKKLIIIIIILSFSIQATAAHLSSVALPLFACQKAKEETLRPVASKIANLYVGGSDGTRITSVNDDNIIVLRKNPEEELGRYLADDIACKILRVIRDIDAKYGEGTVVIYGGIVRDLLLRRRKPIADIDILIKENNKLSKKEHDKYVRDVAMMLEKGLGLRRGSILRANAYVNDTYIDFIGLYNPSDKTITPRFEPNQYFGKIQLSIDTMWMQANGMVFDFYGGMADLKDGIIRFVGSDVEEYANHLTVLRAVRYKHELGFAYEEKTRDIVNNFFTKPERFQEREVFDPWLRKAEWWRKYLDAKKKKDRGRISSLIQEYYDSVRYESPEERVKISLGFHENWILEIRGLVERGDPLGLRNFEGTLKINHDWPEGTNVKVNFDHKKGAPLKNDSFGFGISTADIIKHSKDPVAAIRELEAIGAALFLRLSGIDLEKVLKDWQSRSSLTDSAASNSATLQKDHENTQAILQAA